MIDRMVSIVTPCYNGEAFLDKYFQSILNQTYKNIELIFVDDGSTDSTKKIALLYKEKFEQVNINFTYVYQENAGQAAAVKKGLPLVKGEFLIWPDSDDILAPNSIEHRVNFLINNPEYRIVRSNGHYFDFETGEYLNPISEDKNRSNEDIFLDLILQKTYCSCGCYMVYYEDLKNIYPTWDIYISPEGQNWQILIPLAGRYKCGYIDEDLYFIAKRQSSHSRAKRKISDAVERHFELNRVLSNTLKLSGRNDRDYDKIIQEKLYRDVMHFYFNYKDKKNGWLYLKKMIKFKYARISDIVFSIKKSLKF